MGNNIPFTVKPSVMTDLINRMAADNPPDQWLREYVQNSIEAIQRTDSQVGEIHIDFNPIIFKTYGLYKVSITDNGDGMSEKQLEDLIRSIGESGHKNQYENHGVGSKISALTRNHHGIDYESWKDGEGFKATVEFDPERNEYGLKGHRIDDSLYHTLSLDPRDKPEIIQNHGTRVTLWGMTDEQDTMVPPEGTPGGSQSWMMLYLNTRYYEFPKGITVKAREGYLGKNTKNYLGTVTGMKEVLEKNKESSGEYKFPDANLRWWILKEKRDGHGREFLAAHTAFVHQNEIFDLATVQQNRGRFSDFGIMFGRNRVVIHLEPYQAVQGLMRTSIVKKDQYGSGVKQTMDKWAEEFRNNLPRELEAYLEKIKDNDMGKSNSDTIQKKLSSISDLYRLSRFKLGNGSTSVNTSEIEINAGVSRKGDAHDDPTPPSESGGGVDNSSVKEKIFNQSREANAKKLASNKGYTVPWPEFYWRDDHTQGDIPKDRAASYDRPSNTILANRSFPGFTDLIEWVMTKHANDISGERKIVTEIVYEAFQMVLTEAVAGALALENRPEWKPDEFKQALSPESLTIAVMPKHNLLSYINRAVGNRIGKSRGPEDD